MLSSSRFQAIILLTLALVCAPFAKAQTTSTGTDTEDDSVQLFQSGQDAHEAGDLARALQLYEQAIKARPEFPEAEYQRATVLVALDRLPDAEKGFRRAMELQPEWSLPYLTLGKLLARQGRADEAEKLLNRSVELDENNFVALVVLTDLHLQSRASREKLRLLLEKLKSATARDQANANLWAARGSVERALDDKTTALSSFDRALLIDRQSVPALVARAQLRVEEKNFEGALSDALAAERASKSSPDVSLLVARIYAQSGRTDDALRTLDSLDEAGRNLPEAVSLRNTLTKDCGNLTKEERAAEEELLKQQPQNASLLECLGAALRTTDPARSLELYRQAAEIEPRNVRYATGYAAALVQARRFAEAAVILRRIIAVQPDNFAAHTNLATALYELKQFPAALAEFKWLVATRPELVVAYYFIATAHDFLGEYTDALAAYETFLARAQPQTNQLEIDKVNLRLPSLRNQIKRGQGSKKKRNSE
ncbi:MAG TPA: tetratricopeptide repeat protein [Pyrinomonadaceae bacterium]|nr:tetratricopeptide repeat protein [Pyrinomonadaceae bacterium]